MLSTRHFLLAMLAVGMVTADCPQQDIVIESDGDADKYFGSSCTQFSHKITIGVNATNVDLNQLINVKEGIECVDAKRLSSIKASKLRSIGGPFSLRGLTVLKTLDFPELVSVGQIDWRTLPALESLDGFTKEITHAESVLITDTLLTSMKGISNLKTAKNFNINNNRFLRAIKVSLQNVSDILDVNSNGKGLQADFPELLWANNITIRDAASVSFPNLEAVNSSASFVSDGFQGIEFPSLTSVGGSFSFVGCPMLSKISALNVTEIGGTFLVANNTKLSVLDGFTSLKKVGGSVDLSGRFTNATLPGLADGDVRGSFNMQTTESFDCSEEFEKLQANDVVKGEYICADKKDTASSLTADGVSTEGTGSSGPKKDSSAACATTSSVLLVAAGLAAFWAF